MNKRVQWPPISGPNGSCTLIDLDLNLMGVVSAVMDTGTILFPFVSCDSPSQAECPLMVKTLYRDWVIPHDSHLLYVSFPKEDILGADERAWNIIGELPDPRPDGTGQAVVGFYARARNIIVRFKSNKTCSLEEILVKFEQLEQS
jgi:hypothetical protein